MFLMSSEILQAVTILVLHKWILSYGLAQDKGNFLYIDNFFIIL